MDRLFTCFVSSTFLDLQAERQRLVRVLLSNECVPLGMEFFPSTGRSQWPVIQDSIAAADFCLFVVAGRYGSISDEPPLSWTHREFREALRMGKPVAAVLHADPHSLPMDRSEGTTSGRRHLDAFRKEIEAHTICRYFRDEADLVEAVTASVRAFRENGDLAGWLRAGPRPVPAEEADFDRVYEVIEIDWTFRLSTTRPDTVDGIYFGRRRFLCNEVDGLRYCALDFTRGNERQLPFAAGTTPQLDLESAVRTDGGAVRLERPRKREGSTFIQDALFDPPLALGEVVDFSVRGMLPSYKYRYREDLAQATADARGGARTYEWMSRRVMFPTRLMTLRAFIADELEAQPYGPLVGRGAVSVDRAMSSALHSSGAYSVKRTERDGVPGSEMELRLDNPSLLRRYRLAWELPGRG